MRDSASTAVIDMARYRQRAAQPQQRNPQEAEQLSSDQIIDRISYHILMAARAIADYSKK
jgi:hypothetical protein